jgi:hypothetical protein
MPFIVIERKWQSQNVCYKCLRFRVYFNVNLDANSFANGCETMIAVAEMVRRKLYAVSGITAKISCFKIDCNSLQSGKNHCHKK